MNPTSSIYDELRRIKKPIIKEIIPLELPIKDEPKIDIIADANAAISALFGENCTTVTAKVTKVKNHKKIIPDPIDTNAVLADIVALLQPEVTLLVPLCLNEVVIHDNATLAAKCPIGHIHKYFLKDIQTARGSINCITCSVANKFANNVRCQCEELLNTPFIIDDTPDVVDKNITTFINPVYKVQIHCVKKPGYSESSTVDTNGQQWLHITMYHTTSDRVIKKTLSEFLHTHEQIPAYIRRKINPNPGDYQKTQIPYVPALAQTFGLSAVEVEDNLLYFECSGL